MKFKILSTSNVIIAELAFMDAQYPDDFIAVIEPVVVLSRKEVIIARLIEIDGTCDKPRTRREMLLAKAGTKAWLQVLDDEAVALRLELGAIT